MSNEKLIDILKGAILLELNGKTFYENTAHQTKNKSVKELFINLAEEESHHIALLSRHYTSLIKHGKILPVKYSENPLNVSASVLTEQVQNEIKISDYEAAAISAAMALEQNAVQYYENHSAIASDANEKELFSWLANWEKTHLQFLSDLDRELRNKVWHDNNFWPM